MTYIDTLRSAQQHKNWAQQCWTAIAGRQE